MNPESFNRLHNSSPEDFDRFIGWLFSRTLAELRAARGDLPATRTAWLHYFQRGLKAELLLDELTRNLPELFHRAQYSADEATNVLAMIQVFSLADMGITALRTGGRLHE